MYSQTIQYSYNYCTQFMAYAIKSGFVKMLEGINLSNLMGLQHTSSSRLLDLVQTKRIVLELLQTDASRTERDQIFYYLQYKAKY